VTAVDKLALCVLKSLTKNGTASTVRKMLRRKNMPNEKRKEYMRNYMVNYLLTHPDYRKKELQRLKNGRKNNPNKNAHYQSVWRERNPEKEKIHGLARSVLRISQCEICPEDDIRTTTLERHHPDYDYPEIIVTVCQECHKWVHRKHEICLHSP
jgi:hypothetical protein